jgi:hypothetical protein
MFYLGTGFCLIWGFIYNLPNSLHGDMGWITESILFLVATIGVAYTIKWTAKIRSWNTFALWFLWLSLILPVIGYWAGLGH